VVFCSIKTSKNGLRLLVIIASLTIGNGLQAAELPDEQGLNCYVFKMSSLALGSNLSGKLVDLDLTRSVITPQQRDITPAEKDIKNNFYKVNNLVALIYSMVTSIPASIVFIVLWLVAFKLVRQPSPALSRTNTES
jgi:hypothetical protein